MISNIIAGVFLVIHGSISIFAGVKNKQLQSFIFDSEFWIERKILGTSFNKVFNILFGIVEFVFGIIILTNLKTLNN